MTTDNKCDLCHRPLIDTSPYRENLTDIAPTPPKPSLFSRALLATKMKIKSLPVPKLLHETLNVVVGLVVLIMVVGGLLIGGHYVGHCCLSARTLNEETWLEIAILGFTISLIVVIIGFGLAIYARSIGQDITKKLFRSK